MIYGLFTVLSAWTTLPEGLVRIASLFSLVSLPWSGGTGGDGISIWSSEEGMESEASFPPALGHLSRPETCPSPERFLGYSWFLPYCTSPLKQ